MTTDASQTALAGSAVYLVEDDRATGGKIGKLLAAIFLALVLLMSLVALWTNRHQFVSQDPFNVPHQSASPGGH